MVRFFGGNGKPIVEENTVEIARIEELEVQADIENIQFIVHEKKKVEIKLETFEKGPELQVNMMNNRLEINAGLPREIKTIINWKVPNCKLEIKIPVEFAVHYTVVTSTGSIKAKNLLFETMTMKTGAGSITAENFHGRELILKSGAGSIKVENIDTEVLETDTGAGSVIGKICSGKIIAKSGAGSIRFTVSGEQDLEMNAGAGSIYTYFTNPKNVNATVHTSTGIGTVKTNLPHPSSEQKSSNLSTTFGDGKYNYELKSGVGSVYLYADE